VWIISPAGFQCEDEPRYESLADARAHLSASGISVTSAEEVDLLVCEACGCPTSLHYRALISSSDVVTAAGLGWLEEQEP
jgi:hypothetical protein